LAHRLAAPLLRWLPVEWKRPIWDAEVILRSLPRALREIAKSPPDVIHGHNLGGFRASLALHYLTRRPCVQTVSCNPAQLAFYGWGGLISEYRRFQNRVARWFIAEPYVEQLRGLGIPASRIGALCGVADLAGATAARADAERHRRQVRKELGVAEDALLALSVGRTDPTKGHEHVVEALPLLVKQFSNLHWVLLGQVHGSPGYQERAAALGVGAHAHVIGYRDEPLPYYAAADVYLRTTLLESDTLASYNAMAVGVPVVGFDCGGATELVPSAGNGILVRSADPAALAEGIRHILSLPDRGRALGARGIAYAARHLDLRVSVEEMVGSYERVAHLVGSTSTAAQ
jgi:glycosyltransferase involved in cell wall biosynthesis